MDTESFLYSLVVGTFLVLEMFALKTRTIQFNIEQN